MLLLLRMRTIEKSLLIIIAFGMLLSETVVFCYGKYSSTLVFTFYYTDTLPIGYRLYFCNRTQETCPPYDGEATDCQEGKSPIEFVYNATSTQHSVMGDPSRHNITVHMVPGNYCFACTAFNWYGESAYSNEACTEAKADEMHVIDDIDWTLPIELGISIPLLVAMFVNCCFGGVFDNFFCFVQTIRKNVSRKSW